MDRVRSASVPAEPLLVDAVEAAQVARGVGLEVVLEVEIDVLGLEVLVALPRIGLGGAPMGAVPAVPGAAEGLASFSFTAAVPLRTPGHANHL